MRLMQALKGFNFPTLKRGPILSAVTVIAALLLISACASSGNSVPSGTSVAGAGIGTDSSRAAQCKATDTLIQSRQQCLQDDAACYQLSNGQWCTGERGSICPSGSTNVEPGRPCPAGSRCFTVSESLQCAIN